MEVWCRTGEPSIRARSHGGNDGAKREAHGNLRCRNRKLRDDQIGSEHDVGGREIHVYRSREVVAAGVQKDVQFVAEDG